MANDTVMTGTVRVYKENESGKEKLVQKIAITPSTSHLSVSMSLCKCLQVHQLDAANKALSRLAHCAGFLIAHEPGLGKTLTTLAIIDTYDAKSPSRI